MTADWYLVVIRHKFSPPSEIMTTLGRALDILMGQPGEPKRDASVFDLDGNELTIEQLRARHTVAD
jgi:hypothetical protein